MEVVNGWNTLCDMAYRNGPRVEEIVISVFDIPKNHDHLTLEYTWKNASKNGGEPDVVPELKKLYAPHMLFECIGVYQWFSHSFPNCEIYLW